MYADYPRITAVVDQIVMHKNAQKSSSYPPERFGQYNTIQTYDKLGRFGNPDTRVFDSGNAVQSMDTNEKSILDAPGGDSPQLALLRAVIRMVIGEYNAVNRPAALSIIVDGVLDKLAKGGEGDPTVYTVDYHWTEQENAVFTGEYTLWMQLRYAQLCGKSLANWVGGSDEKYPGT